MTQRKRSFSFMLSLMILVACNDDDQGTGISSLLPYDSSMHIYGTIRVDDNQEWEAVISPSTGKFDTLPGTFRLAGSISFPNGTTRLTAFQQNKRILITDSDRKLVVQDLATFEYTTIDMVETNGTESIVFPQYIRFGVDENELYILDSDDSFWKIDLESNTAEIKYSDVLDSNNDYISNFHYIKADDNLLFTTNDIAINAGSMTELILLDASSKAIIDSITISESFGLVQHPNNENSFYCLQVPTDDEGFRLMEITVGNTSISVLKKSTEDLAIDNMSLYMQTIHTASNSYICRGGSNSIELPTNVFYSIDLGTGELVREKDFNDSAFLVKLAGE